MRLTWRHTALIGWACCAVDCSSERHEIMRTSSGNPVDPSSAAGGSSGVGGAATRDGGSSNLDAAALPGTCNPDFCPAYGTGIGCCVTVNGSCGVDYGAACVQSNPSPEMCASEPGGIAYVDRETLCMLMRCDTTAAALLEGYTCSADGGRAELTRTLGCGTEVIAQDRGYTGSSLSFDVATGALVGGMLFSDGPFGPCDASVYEWGAVMPACDSAVTYGCVRTASTDPFDGCRAPTEPGCEACCTYHAESDHCTEQSAQGSDWYSVYRYYFGRCDPLCPPCAQCSRLDEQQLRDLPERTDCDCSQPPGIDPCFGPDSCECWCGTMEGLTQACPGIR